MITSEAGAAPPLLRPMLGLSDRIRTTTRLGIVVLVLLVPGVLATSAYTAADWFSVDRAVVLSTSLGGFTLALWFAAAVIWRTRTDTRQTITAIAAIAAADLQTLPLPQGHDDMGDIGRALVLARTQLQDQEAALADAERTREQHLRASLLHQRQAVARFHRRAQETIDESTTVISGELRQVTEKVGEVQGSSEVIGDRITVANSATDAIVAQAHEAEQVISSLELSLHRVAETAALVTGIAGQTRLLALNATIEAARAGELGYGFTVVANEVKQLATHTAEATNHIIETIHALERDTTAVSRTIVTMTEGIAAVGDAAGSLRVVAADQSALMGRLTDQMNATLDRVDEMADLAERLERREHERISATGQVVLHLPGKQSITGGLLNVSAGGMRCVLHDGNQLVEGVVVDVEMHSGAQHLTVPARVVNAVDGPDGREIGMQALITDDALSYRLATFADLANSG